MKGKFLPVKAGASLLLWPLHLNREKMYHYPGLDSPRCRYGVAGPGSQTSLEYCLRSQHTLG